MKSQVKSNKAFDYGSIVVRKNDVKMVSHTGELYTIDKADIPAYCHLPAEGKQIKEASFSLNTAGTVLHGIHPWNGKFFAEFVKFQAKENEQPRWRIQPGGPRTGKDGRFWMAEDKAVFTIICRITSGDFQDCEFAINMDYLFQPDDDGYAILVGKSKGVKAVEDFIRLVGVDYDTLAIRYTDNVLPALEDVILAVKNPPLFEADFENGWPALSELPVGMTSPNHKAKAPVKKEPAKPAPKAASKKEEPKPAPKKATPKAAPKAAPKEEPKAEPKKPATRTKKKVEEPATKEEDWQPPF